MPKNIVICCDGTGNEIGANISNVLKLYRVLRKNDAKQVVFYDPGVGTLARPDPWQRMRQDAQTIFGLATGYGLDDRVLAAYGFLVEHYEEGDEIFLFGFSRGAHTVRVLAGFLHMAGLLRRSQRNLAGAALTAYKQSHEPDPSAGQGAENFAWQFGRIVSARWPTIRFMGVWDTVASVVVPRPDRFYLPSIETLAHTGRNPSVAVFRHAMAIDERRRMFRLSPWVAPQPFRRQRFQPGDAVPQDIAQVWFAGVHADIGGGYPEEESAASKYPLLWMIEEGVRHGLRVDRRTVNQLAWGRDRKGSPFSYVAPSATAPLHDSMNRGWRLLEFLPKPARYREWPARERWGGLYIPDSEPRVIPPGAMVHESVFVRREHDAAYRPVNLTLPRDRYVVVPAATPPEPGAPPPA